MIWYAPPPIAVYDGRRRPNERLYEASVTSARAVLGTPAHRVDPLHARQEQEDGHGQGREHEQQPLPARLVIDGAFKQPCQVEHGRERGEHA